MGRHADGWRRVFEFGGECDNPECSCHPPRRVKKHKHVIELVSVDGLKKMTTWTSEFGPPRTLKAYMAHPYVMYCGPADPMPTSEVCQREYELYQHELARDVWIYKEVPPKPRRNLDAIIADAIRVQGIEIENLRLQETLRRVREALD